MGKGSLVEVGLSPTGLIKWYSFNENKTSSQVLKEGKMAQDEEIQKLRQLGLYEVRVEERKKIIDTLAAYGEAGINPILDIISYDLRTEIREHGLNKIMEVRQRK